MGPAVSLRDVVEHVAERPDALVARAEGHVWALLPVFHLAERVAVCPDDIENLRGSPELRMLQPGQHVPREARILAHLV